MDNHSAVATASPSFGLSVAMEESCKSSVTNWCLIHQMSRGESEWIPRGQREWRVAAVSSVKRTYSGCKFGGRWDDYEVGSKTTPKRSRWDLILKGRCCRCLFCFVQHRIFIWLLRKLLWTHFSSYLMSGLEAWCFHSQFMVQLFSKEDEGRKS